MKTVTSIKIDPALKEDASRLAEQLGLSLSSVINAQLKQFVAERRIVFSDAPKLNQVTIKKFIELDSDLKSGKNISKSFTTVEELKKALSK